MSRRARARKAYHPKPVHLNSVLRAIEGAARLPADQVATISADLTTALDHFSAGQDCPRLWCAMADAINVAESLADLNICSDDSSRQRIADAHAALSAVHMRHTTRGWTLYPAERNALADGLWLHSVQLQHASFREYEAAIADTTRRISQARAGNAPRGAIVLQGALV